MLPWYFYGIMMRIQCGTCVIFYCLFNLFLSILFSSIFFHIRHFAHLVRKNVAFHTFPLNQPSRNAWHLHTLCVCYSKIWYVWIIFWSLPRFILMWQINSARDTIDYAGILYSAQTWRHYGGGEGDTRRLIVRIISNHCRLFTLLMVSFQMMLKICLHCQKWCIRCMRRKWVERKSLENISLMRRKQ